MTRDVGVIVFTWLGAIGEMVEASMHTVKLHDVQRTTSLVLALAMVQWETSRGRHVVVVIDRGATDDRQRQTNALARIVRMLAPGAPLLRIGAKDDFPEGARDRFWCKFGLDLDGLGLIAAELAQCAA